MKQYKYVKTDIHFIEGTINNWAKQGWVVVSFNRNPNASTVDVLMEKDAE